MPSIKSPKAKWTATAIIRDKHGKPKLKWKDHKDIPERIWNALTEDEKEELKNGSST